ALGQAADAAGAYGSDLAQNRFARPALDAAGDAAGMLAKINPAAGMVAAAFAKVGQSAADLNNSFLQRAQELTRYSGAIAGAQARANVRSIQSDVREAQALGPGFARLTDANSELMAELRELILPLKKFLLEVVARIAENAVELVKWAREAVVK